MKKHIALAIAVCITLAALAACSPESKENDAGMRTPPIEAAQPGGAAFSATPSSLPTLPEETPVLDVGHLFANNSNAGEDVLLALYSHLRGVKHEAEWFDARAAEGTKIAVYAWRSYGSGTLAVADFYMGGELAPDLYYIENGEVRYFTAGSDVWSINYARLFGNAIVYGKSFAWDNGIQSSTRAAAGFFDGQTDEVDMPCTAKDDENITGFIFIAEGRAWLKSLEIFDGDALVTDNNNYQFVYSNLYDGALTVRESTRFNAMYDAVVWARRAADSQADIPAFYVGGEGERHNEGKRIYKDSGILLADLWRSNLTLFDAYEIQTGDRVDIRGIDASDIVEAFWADTALDDGTEAGLAACADGIAAPREAGGGDGITLAFPDTHGRDGRYVLVIETAEAYCFAPFMINK